MSRKAIDTNDEVSEIGRRKNKREETGKMTPTREIARATRRTGVKRI